MKKKYCKSIKRTFREFRVINGDVALYAKWRAANEVATYLEWMFE